MATADGHGTFEIMLRAQTSKPTVWRWQQRYLDEGIAGLKRDKTRPSRVPPLPRETRLKVIAKTVQEVPLNATHCSRSLMAEAVGIHANSLANTSACCRTFVTDSACKSGGNPCFLKILLIVTRIFVLTFCLRHQSTDDVA